MRGVDLGRPFDFRTDRALSPFQIRVNRICLVEFFPSTISLFDGTFFDQETISPTLVEGSGVEACSIGRVWENVFNADKRR